MLRKTFIKIAIIFLAFSILFTMLYVNTSHYDPGKPLIGSLRSTKSATPSSLNFASSGSSIRLSVLINYDLPSNISSNVTITSFLNISLMHTGKSSILTYNFTTTSRSITFTRTVDIKPGSFYSATAYFEVSGNSTAVHKVFNMSAKKLQFYASIEMEQEPIYLFTALGFLVAFSATVFIAIWYGQKYFE